MKRCFKCLAWKSIAEFYRHPKMAAGVLGKCKECTKADVKRNYQTKREKFSDYDRRRWQTPDRKAKSVSYAAACRKRNPQKARARWAVCDALRSGRLTRTPCVFCGELKTQAHHSDYSRPLDVTWVCFVCHREKCHGQVVTRREYR